MNLIRRYFPRYRRDILLGQSFKLVEAVLELFLPLVMASLIDEGVKTGERSVIFARGAQMLLIALIGLATALVCQVVASRASQNFGTELRGDVFRHLNTLSHADVDRFGTASLITRITADVNQLQYALAMLIRLVVRAPFLCVGSIVMAMCLNLQLSAVFLVITPLIALTLYLVMKRSIPFFSQMQRKLDRIARISRENLEGARVVRAFSRQEHERARFAEAADDYTDTAVRVGRLSALLNPATSVVMNFGILAILWLGGAQVQRGILSQGVVIAFISYVTQIALQIVVVANLVTTFTKAGASLARVQEVLSAEPSLQDAGSDGETAGADAVEFDGVSFRYPGGGEDALCGVCLRVPSGWTVGVIGGTGSGKSTLASLIPRFYDATAGSVRVFGTDVSRYPLPRLRGMIGFVPQAAALIGGSVRKNLLMGKQDATDEEIWHALDIAQARAFVERLPGRLDYLVEEGGKNLSGGQKQRLTIARALLRRPRILILDDSASALDFQTDAALRRAIHEDTQDMTVFIVSQRASAIRQADLIVVLDDGRVAGQGTHAALMESCEIYREICLSQLSSDEAAG